MLRRRWLLNLALAVVAALLAVAAVMEQERTALATRLTPLSPNQIERVALHRAGGQEVELARSSHGWQMLQPFRTAADTAPVDRLLVLASATVYRSLPAEGMDLPRLGLAPPAIRLRLDDVELRLGTTEPIADRRYVQVGDMIHLIDDDRLPDLLADAETFVAKRLLPAGFSPGNGSIDGRPLTADALAGLPDVEALQVERLGEQLSGHLLAVESADGGEGVRFMISDDGLRWSRLDLRLTYVLETPPLWPLVGADPDSREPQADGEEALLPDSAPELQPEAGSVTEDRAAGSPMPTFKRAP